MFRTIERYEEDGLGLPYPVVLLDAVEEEIDEETGEVLGVSVPDAETLAVAVALTRALIPLQLAGREVRFLRSVLGMKSSEAADATCIAPETFSRWENDKQEVGEWADKELRLMVVVALGRRLPHFSLDVTAVNKLRIVKRAPNQPWPTIEMRRVATTLNETDADEEWDTLPLAA